MTDIKKGFCKIRSVGCLHKRIEDFLRIYYKSIYHQLWIHYYIILWKLFSLYFIFEDKGLMDNGNIKDEQK